MRHLGRPSATLGDPRCDPPRYLPRRLFENEKRRGEARRPAPSAANPVAPKTGVVGAIFPGRRGVGNAVCRNFLFPLGWPACGVNSSLPAGGGGLRNFEAASPPPPRLTRRGVGALRVRSGRERDDDVRRHRRATGKWCTHNRGSSSYCARSNDARQRPQ